MAGRWGAASRRVFLDKNTGLHEGWGGWSARRDGRVCWMDGAFWRPFLLVLACADKVGERAVDGTITASPLLVKYSVAFQSFSRRFICAATIGYVRR